MSNDTSRDMVAGGNGNLQAGGRPRVDQGTESRFVLRDRVYLRVGRSSLGPYLIAEVRGLNTYILCTEDGQLVNDGTPVHEDNLERT